MNQMNEMYSLGPGPRVAVSQHNTLQARGFFLDAQHFIQHRVEQLEDLKLHLIHSRPLRVGRGATTPQDTSKGPRSNSIAIEH